MAIGIDRSAGYNYAGLTGVLNGIQYTEVGQSVVFYIVAAGAYEGNMGTAFRHKSLILWVVILLLASTIVATKERKTEDRGLRT